MDAAAEGSGASAVDPLAASDVAIAKPASSALAWIRITDLEAGTATGPTAGV
jgi:hypothetical protein